MIDEVETFELTSDPWKTALVPEDDYLDRESQTSSKGGIGITTAVFNLVTCVVGAAIFNLPGQAKKSGIIFSIFFLCISMLLSIESGSLWSAVSLRWNEDKAKKECLAITSFERFGQAAYGSVGRILIMTFNSVFYIGVCGAYAIFVGNSLHGLFGIGDKWNQRWTRLFLGPIYMGFAMLNDLNVLSKLAPVGVVAAFSGCFALIVKGSIDFQGYSGWDDLPSKNPKIYSWWPEQGFLPVGSTIAFMFMSYGVMGLIPTTATEMREPKKMPLVLWVMGLSVFVLYTAVIITCYGAYGNFLASDILDNLKKYPENYAQVGTLGLGGPTTSTTQDWTGKDNKVWYYFAAASVVSSLVLAYPFIMMTVFCSIQETDFVISRAPPGTWANRGIRLAIVTFTLLIALAIDDFGVVFDLFASLCLPIMNVAIPIVFSWKLRTVLEMPHPPWWRVIYHGFFCVFGAFAGIFGTVDAVKNIVKQWT